ncbi:MAG: LacI family DNA-binding transcriptional regulator [Blautia hansenii]
MNRKKITSTDVARKAGVSQSAVSMILNKKYNVSFSRETIERVEEAARTLGYTNEKKCFKNQGVHERKYFCHVSQFIQSVLLFSFTGN